jgi:hypothetical protein
MTSGSSGGTGSSSGSSGGGSSGSSGGSGSGSGGSSGSSGSSGTGSSSGGSSSGGGSGSSSGGNSSGGPSPYDCNWGNPVFTNLPVSSSPPGGLASTNVPQFIALGFDDNRYTDGVQWALDTIKPKVNPAGSGNHCTFDGLPARISFLMQSLVSDMNPALAALHRQAYMDGNEVGNHTDTHATTLQQNPDVNVWTGEMTTCNGYLSGLGIPQSAVEGFRTPFLSYSTQTFDAMVMEKFVYDCSIEHFLGPGGEDWPYTLDSGPSKNSYAQASGPTAPGNRPGLWELPVHEFLPSTGWVGVTGLDYNIWCVKQMNPTDALALLKASLDIRFKGDSRAPANRAPFFIGGHTHLYSNDYVTQNPADAATCANTVAERQQVIQQFIDYALSYDPSVRIVPYGQVLRWMQNPTGLDGTKGH